MQFNAASSIRISVPFLAGLLALGLLSANTHCNASSVQNTPAGDGAPVTDAVVSVMCPDDVPPARGLSERCCPSFGADACGAGLFCAALDGRTIPTCYPEHSRAEGATCTANGVRLFRVGSSMALTQLSSRGSFVRAPS